MINNHGYYSPSIVKMDTMVTITTVKLYIVGVVSDGNLQMMRVGWKVARKLRKTHRKVLSHFTHFWAPSGCAGPRPVLPKSEK